MNHYQIHICELIYEQIYEESYEQIHYLFRMSKTCEEVWFSLLLAI